MRFFVILSALFWVSIWSASAVPSLSGGSENEGGITVVSDAPSGIIYEARKTLLNWQIYINKKIPERMNALRDTPSVAVIAFSAFVAFMYGAIHTLGPGHGKMVVASYLLSRDSSVVRGCWIGIKVAIAHVGMAVVIVLFADFAMSKLLLNPDEKMFALKMFSFGVIVLVGLFMAYIAMKKIFKGQVSYYCSACNTTHDIGHVHVRKQLASLAPTAKDNALKTLSFTASEIKVAESVSEKNQDSIISFAVGMVPCTGSLLILLYAMANDMLWWGVAMVVCVAVGMAVMMICIGLLCYAGRKALVDRYLNQKSNAQRIRMNGFIELVGASAIVLIGCLFISALML